jgi:16S rRNA (cytosine1402-N4)-methyltransferase
LRAEGKRSALLRHNASPVTADFAHDSVLVTEVIDLLAPRDHCVYVDGTLGGAGHAAAILARAPAASIIGIDRDPAALDAARARLPATAQLVHASFGDLPAILDRKVDGILLDLGVSSPQLDRAERGFSFTRPGPLDMRMDPTRGMTALDLIHTTDAGTLGELIAELGEERHAKKIARAIKEAVRTDAARTTTELADVIARQIPMVEQRKSKIHPATRTFQALRIAVNGELAELARLLDAFPDLLAPGGRCAIISFHSLEDRLVKTRFRDLAWTTSLPVRLAEQAGERVAPVVEILTKKPVIAGEAEVARNPRARSAKLRACERTTAPNVPPQAGRPA